MIEYLAQYGHAILIDVLRLCLWLAVLTIVFVPLERLFALHPQPVLRAEIGADVGYYFLNGLLPAMLISFPLGFVAWAVHRFIPHGFLTAVAGAPCWSRMLAGLVVSDLGYYWAHRCLHGVPLLWRFHALHHSAQHVDFIVNTRAHPVDMAFGRMCGLIPLYLLGLAGPIATADSNVAAQSAIPVTLLLVGTVWSFFVHANLRWHCGALEWVLSTPRFHHWHHTIEAPFSHNYASMLPVLDRLFGTLKLPAGQWPARYGIHEPIPNSLAEQLIEPFTERRPSSIA
jgi:sterol desaturase/sphingolipid hydroxylase (fatty acid hydroxylase superfamily)